MVSKHFMGRKTLFFLMSVLTVMKYLPINYIMTTAACLDYFSDNISQITSNMNIIVQCFVLLTGLFVCPCRPSFL